MKVEASTWENTGVPGYESEENERVELWLLFRSQTSEMLYIRSVGN